MYLVREALPSCTVNTVGDSVGEPVHEREPRVHLDGKATVRRRDERAPTDPECLYDEPTLTLTAAHVLDNGVREDDVELAVSERKRAGVSLDVADRRVASTETGPIVEPERRDPLGPGIVLLEEVQGPAAVALSEAELVGAHVENRRVRRGLELVEEELELAPARAQRDGVDEPPRR